MRKVAAGNTKNFWQITFFVLFFCSLFTWFNYNFHHGERVWVEDGLGWDGEFYGTLAADFDSIIINKQISAYRIKHALPSATIFLVSKVFSIDLNSAEQKINAFYILNLIAISIIIIYSFKLAQHFQLSGKHVILYLILMVVTLPVLKKFPYYPVTTDIMAMMFGVLAIYYYYMKKPIILIISILLGSFTFPSFIYFGMPLLIFYHKPWSEYKLNINNKVNLFIRLAIISIILIIIAGLIFADFASGHRSAQYNKQLIVISTLAIAIYTFYMLKPIDFRHLLPGLPDVKYTALFVLLMIIVYSGASVLSNNEVGEMQPGLYIKSIFYGSVVNPLISLVAHFSFYGPSIILIIIFWSKILMIARNDGPGILYIVLMYIIFSFGRESRQLIIAYPLFVILLMRYIKDFRISEVFTLIIFGISIVVSKVWFTINKFPMINDSLTEMPQQRFFMMNGAYMNTDMYFVHLGGAILVLGIILLTLRNQNVFSHRSE